MINELSMIYNNLMITSWNFPFTENMDKEYTAFDRVSV